MGTTILLGACLVRQNQPLMLQSPIEPRLEELVSIKDVLPVKTRHTGPSRLEDLAGIKDVFPVDTHLTRQSGLEELTRIKER
ncbi:MAG: hypothetical protein ACWGN2_12200 [Anaerolineales bacterium]